MKKLILVFFVLLAAFISCKKSSDKPDTPDGPTGNYIQIDNDARELGDVPSPEVYVNQSDAGLPEVLMLTIGVYNKTDSINETNNDLLLMNIHLREGGPSSTEYNIVNMLNPPPSSALVNVVLTGIDVNLNMTGKAGKLYVTRDGNNKITSIKFDQIDMNGTYEATVSSHIVIN